MNAPLEMTKEQAFPDVDLNLIPATPGGSMGEFFGALAKAQAMFMPIEKNKNVTIRPRDKPSYSFKYADLAEILEKTKAGRAESSLALTQLVTNKSSSVGGVMIRTILGHSSGARMEAVLDVPRGREGEVKDFGAYITYLRRYIVGPMLGVAADDDIDQDGSEGHDDPPMVDGHPSEPRNPAPSNPAESPLLRDAKSVRELSTAFNKFSPENKDRFRAQYERLLTELDAPPPAAASATTKGTPTTQKKDDL